MTVRHKVYLAVLLTLALLGAGTGLWAYRSYSALNVYLIPRRAELYHLTEGHGAGHVARDLLGGEFYGPLVSLWLKKHPELLAVQKGEYLIDGSKTLEQILTDMAAGNVVEKVYPTVVIVEGTTFKALLRRLGETRLEDPSFMAALKDPRGLMDEIFKDDRELLEALGGARDNFEGLLMPATYPLLDREPFRSVVSQAMRKMARYIKKVWPGRDSSIPLKNAYEALIMASIIERETLLDEERSQIAAVFYNRLRKNMRLQTDPTVMYGIDPTFSDRLRREQLSEDTPYNTYTRNGLTPTPISMPREASIYAALHPASSDALYFVARDISPVSGHVFSETLTEHNRAVAEYRRKVRAYREAQQAGNGR